MNQGMKRTLRDVLRGLGAIVLIALATSALLIGAIALFGTPLDHAVIEIDDASFALGDLTSAHWLLAFAGLALALLAVPVAVLIALAIGILGSAFGLAVALAAAALVCPPLILIGWVLWRLLRSPPSSPSTPTSPAAATIAR